MTKIQNCSNNLEGTHDRYRFRNPWHYLAQTKLKCSFVRYIPSVLQMTSLKMADEISRNLTTLAVLNNNKECAPNPHWSSMPQIGFAEMFIFFGFHHLTHVCCQVTLYRSHDDVSIPPYLRRLPGNAWVLPGCPQHGTTSAWGPGALPRSAHYHFYIK